MEVVQERERSSRPSWVFGPVAVRKGQNVKGEETQPFAWF